MPSRSAPASGRTGRTSTGRTSTPRRRTKRAHIPPDAIRVVVGLICMLLGVATLIALLLPSQGRLTDTWRDSIAPWVGFGRWLLPFLLLALGWWMVERAKSVRGDWELTSAGAIVGFVAGLGLVELVRHGHGGILGKQLIAVLPPLITTPGTALLLTVIMIAGFLLAIDRSLPAAIAHTSDDELADMEAKMAEAERLFADGDVEPAPVGAVEHVGAWQPVGLLEGDDRVTGGDRDLRRDARHPEPERDQPGQQDVRVASP